MKLTAKTPRRNFGFWILDFELLNLKSSIHNSQFIIHNLFLAAVLIASVAACSCAGNKEEAAKEAVRRYNEALVDAYMRPDPELMARYTTPKEQSRIREYIFFLLKEKHLLRCELREIKFLGTAISGATAVAHTKEDWTCRKISSETRQSAEAPSPFIQEVNYELEFTEGRWVVASVEVEKPPAPPPAAP